MITSVFCRVISGRVRKREGTVAMEKAEPLSVRFTEAKKIARVAEGSWSSREPLTFDSSSPSCVPSCSLAGSRTPFGHQRQQQGAQDAAGDLAPGAHRLPPHPLAQEGP
eukprot:1195367-Prorocentrum_minimum.AAC.1